jgi:hypothetical protein
MHCPLGPPPLLYFPPWSPSLQNTLSAAQPFACMPAADYLHPPQFVSVPIQPRPTAEIGRKTNNFVSNAQPSVLSAPTQLPGAVPSITPRCATPDSSGSQGLIDLCWCRSLFLIDIHSICLGLAPFLPDGSTSGDHWTNSGPPFLPVYPSISSPKPSL